MIQYTGTSGGESAGQLFIDTDYFDQPLGDVSKGEREIDAQVWLSTLYTGYTMNHLNYGFYWTSTTHQDGKNKSSGDVRYVYNYVLAVRDFK